MGGHTFKPSEIKDFGVSSLPKAVYGVLMFYSCLRRKKKIKICLSILFALG